MASGKVELGCWLLLESLQVVRRYPEPKALKVKLDMLEMDNKGAWRARGWC